MFSKVSHFWAQTSRRKIRPFCICKKAFIDAFAKMPIRNFLKLPENKTNEKSFSSPRQNGRNKLLDKNLKLKLG